MKKIGDAKRIITSDNLDLYYWVSGNSNTKKTPMVLHSGASMNHSFMGKLEKGLNELGHPTIVFDHRGIGYSKAPAKAGCYSLDNYSNDLQKIIEKEGIEKPDLVTHSFGFMIGVDYALRTKNVGKITGICGSSNFSETANPLLFSLWNNVLRYMGYVTRPVANISDKISGRKTEYGNYEKAKSEMDISMIASRVPQEEFKNQLASGSNILNWNITEKLKHLETPLHMIHGKNDIIVKPCAGEKIARIVKGTCELDVIDGTHSLPIFQYEKILEVMHKSY